MQVVQFMRMMFMIHVVSFVQHHSADFVDMYDQGFARYCMNMHPFQGLQH